MNRLLRYLVVTAFSATPALAADGTWIQNNAGDASGSWGVDANWLDGIIADGEGFTADFSTLDVDGLSTISLGEPRVIGNLIFGDDDNSTVSRWILDNGGTATNILTLSGTTPTITVNNLGPGSISNSTVNISAVIAGTMGLVKDGDGTVAGTSTHGRGVLVLSGANQYSGGTLISAGALRVENASALGTGEVTVASGAQLQIRGVSIANTININGSTALFSNASSGSNLTGVVNLQSNSTINLATNAGNGTLTLSGTVNLNGNDLRVTPAGSANIITISGVINGTGSITKDSAGELRINNDNSTTFSGTTTLRLGILQLGSDGALGSGTFAFSTNNNQSATIRSSNATDRTIGAAVTIAAVPGTGVDSRYVFGSATTGKLTFTNTTDISLGVSQKRLGVSNVTQFDAGFTGSGGINKENAGTLILAGNNTYSGNTDVQNGAVELAETGSLTFYIGANGVTNQLLGTGTAQLDGAFVLDLSGADRTDGNLWNLVDVTTLATTTYGATFNVADFADVGGNLWRKTLAENVYYEFSEDTGSLTFVPEPSTAALLGVAALGLLKRRRRDA